MTNIGNHDDRLKYYELLLEKEVTGPFPEYPLPKGYHFTYYHKGDQKNWIEIEYSAKELISEEEGNNAWSRFYGGKEEELLNRMFFIETDNGEKVATATAFYEPKDKEGAGWLHWVAVKREHQGRGLAKPLISHTLNRLVELGYKKIKIPTQTTTWLAVKIYLNFGFLPDPKNALSSRMGYQIIRTITDHQLLHNFPCVPENEIWDPQMIWIDRRMKELFSESVRFRADEKKQKIYYQIDGVCGEMSFERLTGEETEI